MYELLWILGLVGHAGIWATVYNQIHATACPKNSRKLLEKAILLTVFLPILVMSVLFVPSIFRDRLRPFQTEFSQGWFSLDDSVWLRHSALVYAWLCVLAGLFFTARWCFRRLRDRTPAAVRSVRPIRINVKKELRQSLLRGWLARGWGLIPFNQAQLVEKREMVLELDIPKQLQGLRICHLSDLHFTGQLDRKYFDYLVQQANQFEPHLTVITGDLVDNDKCVAWLPETLGHLRASLGRFFVLGNHDLLVENQRSYLQVLEDIGLKRLNNGWNEILFQGAVIRLAGNELPWYSGAEQLPRLSPPIENEFRLLLTHSPDQISWAVQHRFTLVLAGHNHGGQIRFPIIGPVIVPSRYGVKYASGTFEKAGTILHVSRGISGDEPIRIGCPPELGLLTLTSTRLTRTK